MIIFKEAVPLQKHLAKLREIGATIGFVPTMGALHKGHLSLIETSKSQCKVTVSSIFVNPTQFNDPKDFEKYPVTINQDILLLENEGCDVLFLPSVHEMYPHGTGFNLHYDLGEIENVLEGKFRPGHFQGVCQAVHRLLDVVDPNFLFTGQKDYQQYLVLKKLVQLVNKKATVIKVDTYREESGLAMSSRNLRLTSDQKEKASEIYQTLNYIKNNLFSVSRVQLEKNASDHLVSNGFSKVDYVSIANSETLQPLENDASSSPPIALIAAFIDDIRLIDNMVLTDQR